MNQDDIVNQSRKAGKNLWEKKWSDESYTPIWKGRGIAPEIISSIQEGWLPSGGNVLDIGCGEGAIANWFYTQGYNALGIDISDAVIKKARLTYSVDDNATGSLEFLTSDITDVPPPNKSYNIVIDRGCLHAIPPALQVYYIANLKAVCAPDAKIILFIRAFRSGRSFNDPEEVQQHLNSIRKIFAGHFKIHSYKATNIGRTAGEESGNFLPGMVFRLEKVT